MLQNDLGSSKAPGHHPLNIFKGRFYLLYKNSYKTITVKKAQRFIPVEF